MPFKEIPIDEWLAPWEFGQRFGGIADALGAPLQEPDRWADARGWLRIPDQITNAQLEQYFRGRGSVPVPVVNEGNLFQQLLYEAGPGIEIAQDLYRLYSIGTGLTAMPGLFDVEGWTEGFDLGDVFDGFDLGETLGGIGNEVVEHFTSGVVNDVLGSVFGGGSSGGRSMPVAYQPRSNAMPTLMTDSGDDYGGGLQQVGLGSAVAAGGVWLGSFLARSLGRGAAGAVYQAANGIRVRLNQIWPLIRKYGPQNVAGALGITVGALGTLAMQAPQGGARTGRRGRGISARDIKTTKRTIRQLKKMTRMAGIRTGGGYRPYRSYAPRRRYR